MSMSNMYVRYRSWLLFKYIQLAENDCNTMNLIKFFEERTTNAENTRHTEFFFERF